MTNKPQTPDNTAISVKHLAKDFYLPHEKSSRSLKSTIVNMFKKKDKDVDTQHALRDISFDIKKGEFFGIVGRNGSGKSTLLKILAGIYQPTKGEAKTQGKIVPFIELGVGFNPELSGRENVYLNGALLGFSREEIDTRYDDIVKFAELEDFMEQKLKNYSSGMQVRLAFSVATHAQADVLIVDEVLAVGDADFQRKCYDYFTSLRKTNTTVVFVTHDMSAVREYCDRVILIEDGKIMHKGKPEMVSDEYLQLFNGDNKFSDERLGNRWGSGELEMEQVDLNYSREYIEIIILVKSYDQAVDNFIIGYNFSNASESVVMGGNSNNAAFGAGRLSIGKNSRKKVSFTTPNFLGTGEYSLEVAIKSSNGSMYDKWTGVKKMKVSKIDSYYPTVAWATMKIEDGRVVK